MHVFTILPYIHVQVTVKGELCTLNTDQFQLLADELRDQMLNVCITHTQWAHMISILIPLAQYVIVASHMYFEFLISQSETHTDIVFLNFVRPFYLLLPGLFAWLYIHTLEVYLHLAIFHIHCPLLSPICLSQFDYVRKCPSLPSPLPPLAQNCSLESLDNQGQTVQSLSELSGRVAELQELVDTFPMFDNTSDEFDNLELFLCGVNRSDTGLLDVLKRFTQGDSYRQCELVGNVCIG